ncbi:MAG TPA: hypothetical protein VGE34_03810 [Candidatus Saccharimonadales bacterium]
MGRANVLRYGKLLTLSVGAVIAMLSGSTAFAEVPTSPKYQLPESQFGVGSLDQSCSSQYCSTFSVGDPVSGTTKSAGSTAQFGTIVDDTPSLEVIVESTGSNVGVLSAERTATKTMTVKVLSYQSNGYTLQIVGNPPKYGDHVLKTPASPTDSQPGTEQFGINAVANSFPSVGADPVQVPSSQMSFGKPTDNYNIANKFMYQDGDVVGSSDKESGRTDFTISMIVNVSNGTPAGQYAGDFSAVVVPVY